MCNPIRKQGIRYKEPIHSTTWHADKANGVEYLTFPMLDAIGIHHGFSTRLGGVSEGYLGSMNLSFSRGDDVEKVMQNHHLLADAIGYDYDKVVFSDQTHSVNLRTITAEDAGKGLTRLMDYAEIDGLVTNVPGIPLMTFYADCVPIFLADPVQKVVAAVHSGWRGTLDKISTCMLQKMQEEFGCQLENIYAAIGPSICGDCYEISEEVAKRFRPVFHDCETWLTSKGEGKYLLDLWKINEQALVDAGILASHLAISDLCTCCNPEFLFSHRASHGQRGNLAAVIWL